MLWAWLATGVSAAVWAGPLQDAAASGDLAGLQQALVQSPRELNAANAQGQTPLVLALNGRHFECFEALLAAGANPNGSGPQGWTPLHEASLHGDLPAVQRLLALKANPNAREKQNRGTPLHVAAFQGHLEVARALLRAGADVNSRDGEGLTPSFHAKDQAHPQLLRLFKSSGAR
jgi:uncharacterized protein